MKIISRSAHRSNYSFDNFIFPYHSFRHSHHHVCFQQKETTGFNRSEQILMPFGVIRSLLFKKVCAAENEGSVATADALDAESVEKIKHDKNLEALAKAYIQQETGWDRVKSLFQKDHRGKSNVEISYIQVTLVQVFILSFFIKYFPAAKFARKEFIRENQGTVFRTRFEALRLLQDHTFMRAGGEAAYFSTKVTLLSASFLLFSSLISHYRNKTSVLDYSLAAGITGGLARMNLGIMGLVVGSLVGGALGSAVGLIGYISLSAYGLTQEERHLQATKEKLEVFRSIEGESAFKDKINQLLKEDTTLQDPSS